MSKKFLKKYMYVCKMERQGLLLWEFDRLVEHIILDKIADAGSFKANVALFEERGFISAIQKDVIEKTLDAGDAVTHRAFKPDEWLVADVVDIAESLIEMLYVNSSRSRCIEKKTPPRKK